MEAEDVRRVVELLGSFPGTKRQRLSLAADDVRASGSAKLSDAELALLVMSEIAAGSTSADLRSQFGRK